MSYISIIIPAFHLNSSDFSEIQKQCSIQFNVSSDNFELLKINDNTNNINYGIKFIESCLCLSSLEDLIYERNCMQSLSEKTYESLQSMNKRLNELENQLCSFNNSNDKDNNDKDLMNDNIKLKQLLVSQIEYSDNFRINTENTLNKIKDEFKSVVNELEKLRKKPENKSIYSDNSNTDNVIKKYLNNCGNSSLSLLSANNQNSNWMHEGNTNNNGDTFINHSIGADNNKTNISQNIMGNK